MIEDFIRQPCTLVSRPVSGRDRYNNPIRDLVESETVCCIWKKSGSEPGDQVEVSVTDWRAAFLPDVQIDRAFQLVIGTDRFEFVGAPFRVGIGQTHHIEADLRLIAGGSDG